jgi:hypothetical protein
MNVTPGICHSVLKTMLVLFTRLYKDARSAKYKIHVLYLYWHIYQSTVSQHYRNFTETLYKSSKLPGQRDVILIY